MRDKRTLLYLVILSIFFLSMMALLASADTGHQGAKSSALYNPETRSFVHQSNAEIRLPMASTTKIVTALIAIEELDPEKIISVPKDAAGIEGSSLYLNEGDEISALDLIYSVLLQSANDAAATLAIEISGSIESFAALMNERVRKIGITDTNFENPHGLDSEDHYTTAADLALIASEAMQNEVFKEITSTYKHTFKIGDKIRTVVNHNKLLKLYDGCIGVKTGFTRKSGRCLVSAAERDGITLIAVTLNDPDDWKDHKAMLDRGFDCLEAVRIKDIISIPEDINTVSSDGKTVALEIEKEIIVKYIDEEISVSSDIPSYLAHNVSKGDKIGTINIKLGDRTETINILAKEDLKIKKVKRHFL